MSVTIPALTPIFRFAPSPNGLLHLGHAYSALVNQEMARQAGGKLLLRIEDIDRERCLPEYEEAMLEDLHWLGIEWHGEPRRQSQYFDDYRQLIDNLVDENLAYPSFLSRLEIRAEIRRIEEQGKVWPRDPDGVPHYPPLDKNRGQHERAQMMASHDKWSVRLDLDAVMERVSRPLFWQESGSGPSGESGTIPAIPEDWGDIIIARRDIPTSYHIACVLDDAIQGVTHVVRGRDLFHATSIQRLLQELLGFNVPLYHHHDLVMGDDGCKLSKSRKDTALRELRQAGMTPGDIRKMLGLV